MRLKDVKEVRIQYVFWGGVKREANLIESEEGSLSWINYNDILVQNISATTKEIVLHYSLLRNKSIDQVFVGAMKSHFGEPQITWSLLEDWEESNLFKIEKPN